MWPHFWRGLIVMLDVIETRWCIPVNATGTDRNRSLY